MALGMIIALRKYFGQKDGQTLPEFAAECKFLTEKDRAELAPLLSKELGEEVLLV